MSPTEIARQLEELKRRVRELEARPVVLPIQVVPAPQPPVVPQWQPNPPLPWVPQGPLVTPTIWCGTTGGLNA
jgi:hypothetical protein